VTSTDPGTVEDPDEPSNGGGNTGGNTGGGNQGGNTGGGGNHNEPIGD